MRSALRAIIALLVLSAAPVGLDAADPPARLTARFVMTRTLEVLADSIRSEGTIALGGAGLLRWEMTAPSRSVLVVNGGSAWIHYPDLAITKGFDLGADPVMRVMSEHLLVITGGRLEEVSRFYEVVEEGADVRRLIPRQEAVKAVFSSLRISMTGAGLIRWVEMTSRGGDVTRIEFHDVVPNPTLDPSLFQKPAG